MVTLSSVELDPSSTHAATSSTALRHVQHTLEYRNAVGTVELVHVYFLLMHESVLIWIGQPPNTPHLSSLAMAFSNISTTLLVPQPSTTSAAPCQHQSTNTEELFAKKLCRRFQNKRLRQVFCSGSELTGDGQDAHKMAFVERSVVQLLDRLLDEVQVVHAGSSQ